MKIRIGNNICSKLLIKIFCINKDRRKEWQLAKRYGMSERYFIKSIVADMFKRWIK